MTATRFDVVGIGNAIVDVVARAEDSLIDKLGLARGHMALIDAAEAARIYAAMGPAVESSGGSAANTIAGLSSLGSHAAFIGRVADDQLGQVFRHDIKAAGVHFETPAAAGGKPTAQCLVLVTPDAQRTMATFLGASTELGAGEIDEAVVADAAITYLEGYLYDDDRAKAAFGRAAEIAHGAGRKVALSLSDGFCVARHLADFRALVKGHVDILFANADEITSLYDSADLASAADLLAGQVQIACVTLGAAGSLIVSGDARIEVPATTLGPVVDTTGAGDLYAAGFLHGLAAGADLAQCGRIAALAAAEVISHLGARPQQDLAQLAARKVA